MMTTGQNHEELIIDLADSMTPLPTSLITTDDPTDVVVPFGVLVVVVGCLPNTEVKTELADEIKLLKMVVISFIAALLSTSSKSLE
jgi:hypothetical protein